MRKSEKEKGRIMNQNPKCCVCGRRIRSQRELIVIKGKIYCRKCGERKRDWDFLSLMAMIED